MNSYIFGVKLITALADLAKAILRVIDVLGRMGWL